MGQHSSAPVPALRIGSVGSVRAARGLVVCLVAGVAVWTAFPPLSWWPLAIVGAAVFALAVHELRLRWAALAGLAFGLGQFIPMLSFLRGLGVDAWLVLALIESVWFVLFAVVIAVVGRHRWWPVALPFLWVGQEFVRDRWPFHGFPWGRLGFAIVHSPMLPLASVGGAVLLTFVTAALAAAVAAIGRATLARQRPTAGTMALVALAAAGFGVAAALTLPTSGTSSGGAPAATVAAVQGNVPRLGLDPFAQRRAVTRNHLSETQVLATEVASGRLAPPDVVIWPENSTDDDPFNDPAARSLIEQAVAAVHVPIVVGAVLDGPGPQHVRNAAVVWSPAIGPGEIYVKRHLVPFGEYLPMRSFMTSIVGRFSLIARDFAPGHRPGLLTAGPVRLADVICFEVADDGVVRDAVKAGGRLLVVQTNNASYEHPKDTGHGGETAQQLDMSRLRAVEHGRAVVVAATSGVSALIAPDGHVLAHSGVFRTAVLEAAMPLRDPQTVADRLGAWPERVIAALGLLALLAAIALSWRERHRPSPPAEPVSAPPAELAPQA
jgi:apolipoprotein N-acyltransferase